MKARSQAGRTAGYRRFLTKLLDDTEYKEKNLLDLSRLASLSHFQKFLDEEPTWIPKLEQCSFCASANARGNKVCLPKTRRFIFLSVNVLCNCTREYVRQFFLRGLLYQVPPAPCAHSRSALALPEKLRIKFSQLGRSSASMRASTYYTCFSERARSLASRRAYQPPRPGASTAWPHSENAFPPACARIAPVMPLAHRRFGTGGYPCADSGFSHSWLTALYSALEISPGGIGS